MWPDRLETVLSMHQTHFNTQSIISMFEAAATSTRRHPANLPVKTSTTASHTSSKHSCRPWCALGGRSVPEARRRLMNWRLTSRRILLDICLKREGGEIVLIVTVSVDFSVCLCIFFCFFACYSCTKIRNWYESLYNKVIFSISHLQKKKIHTWVWRIDTERPSNINSKILKFAITIYQQPFNKRTLIKDGILIWWW